MRKKELIIACSIAGGVIVLIVGVVLFNEYVLKKDKKDKPSKKCEKGSGCEDKHCGPDNCGNVDECGKCEKGQVCSVSGKCMKCEPNCDGKTCGNDGCGGSCGNCGEDKTCQNGKCLAYSPGQSCKSSCEGKECGSDGCDGICGYCDSGQVCKNGQCFQDTTPSCIPSCKGKECGDDGCGMICGYCGPGQTCKDGKCSGCIINCTSRICGEDGCGGVCGYGCIPGETCKNGKCYCGAISTRKDNETCVNDVYKCGEFPSCEEGKVCVKGKDGKFKCCPRLCRKNIRYGDIDFEVKVCGVVDECSGQKCECNADAHCVDGICKCGKNDSMCYKKTVCSDEIGCPQYFNIITEYGGLIGGYKYFTVVDGMQVFQIRDSHDSVSKMYSMYTTIDDNLYYYLSGLKLPIYVDYNEDIGKYEISSKKGYPIQLGNNNTLVYKKDGSDEYSYLGVEKTKFGKEDFYYAFPSDVPYKNFVLDGHYNSDY
jgi:hypothetical protein